MKADFVTTKKGTWAYIRKSVRINGRSTTKPVLKLGLLSDIQKEHGCADPRQWVRDLAVKMTNDEKAGRRIVSMEYDAHELTEMGQMPLRFGGDLLLLPVYVGLGLKEICAEIKGQSRIKYDLEEILRTLVMGPE